jgi:hypothetical protein
MIHKRALSPSHRLNNVNFQQLDGPIAQLGGAFD